MNTRLHRKSTTKEALFAVLASFGLLAVFALAIDAQEAPKKDKDKDKTDKPALERRPDHERLESIVQTGYTRPGNVDVKWVLDHEILDGAFKGVDVKKFKIMGGTVYFAVFKNTGLAEDDAFGTGMAKIDSKFKTGRSFKDSYSPRFDSKAKYLYLYQIVNDRGLEAKIAPVKGEKDKKGDPGISFPTYSPKTKVPVTDDIASFALKLMVDPRYITSWGHFTGAGFVANVVDIDINGKIVRHIVDDGKKKVEADKELRLAFSYLPAIVSKLPYQAYSNRARANALDELETGFGVDRSTLNLQQSKAFSDLKLLAGQPGGNVTFIKFAENLVQGAEQVGQEPEYVQLMYATNEERLANAAADLVAEDEATRAIFRVDFDRMKNIKQGDRSVVFGFTTDLPPTAAPIRIDTPKAAALSEGMRLASYFGEGVNPAVGPGAADGIALVAGGADGAALALAMGTRSAKLRLPFLRPRPPPLASPASPAAAAAASGAARAASAAAASQASTPPSHAMAKSAAAAAVSAAAPAAAPPAPQPAPPPEPPSTSTTP